MERARRVCLLRLFAKYAYLHLDRLRFTKLSNGVSLMQFDYLCLPTSLESNKKLRSPECFTNLLILIGILGGILCSLTYYCKSGFDEVRVEGEYFYVINGDAQRPFALKFWNVQSQSIYSGQLSLPSIPCCCTSSGWGIKVLCTAWIHQGTYVVYRQFWVSVR